MLIDWPMKVANYLETRSVLIVMAKSQREKKKKNLIKIDIFKNTT
jgi:hypothetical protein